MTWEYARHCNAHNIHMWPPPAWLSDRPVRSEEGGRYRSCLCSYSFCLSTGWDQHRSSRSSWSVSRRDRVSLYEVEQNNIV
jgi:hypothetical protein